MKLQLGESLPRKMKTVPSFSCHDNFKVRCYLNLLAKNESLSLSIYFDFEGIVNIIN